MTQPRPDPPAARSRRRRAPLVLAAAGVLIGAGLLVWLVRPTTGTAPEAATRVVEATRSTQQQTVGLAGTLAPRSSAALNFTVPGTVTRISVDVGDEVTKGQELARIDDDDLRDALELARANLETALANLDDVDDDGSSAAVTAAKAQVASARAAVRAAEDDVDAAVLTSTIDGTVAALDLSVGDTVGSGAPASVPADPSGTTVTPAQVMVIATARWKLDTSVGSADLASLRPGQPVTVLPDGSREPLSGSIASVGIVATSTSDGSATFPVVVDLDGEHPELYSGTTAAAVVTVAEYPDVLTVPTAAVTTGEDGTAVVAKLVDGRPQPTPVTLGRVFGEATEITAGLVAGDQVQVTIQRPAPPTETGGGIFGPPPPREPEQPEPTPSGSANGGSSGREPGR